MPETAQYVNATQAARLIGVNERTVRLWIDNGKLSATHPMPNRLAIPMSEVQRVIRERQEREELDAIPSPRDMARQLAQLREEVEQARTSPGDQVALGAGDLAHIETRIDGIEERLERLENLLLSQDGATRTATLASARPRRQQREQDGARDLPPGAILLREFALQHGVSPATMRDHATIGIGKGLEKDKLEVSSRPKPGRPHETERYLTPEQQKAALEFWRWHGVPFSEPKTAETGEA